MSSNANNRCQSCNADIIWARSVKTKKWMPLDAMRCESGVRFIIDKRGFAYSAGDGSGHTSHFATCPNAKQHRRDDEQGELDV